MHGVDLAPRICLILFLPSGVTLMAYGPLGDDFFVRGWLLVGDVGGVPGVAVRRGHRLPRRQHPFRRRLQVADLLVRYVLVAVLLAVAAYTILATDPFGVDTNPKWLGAKVAAYALRILCGVLIRRELKPFGPAFGQLVTTGSTPGGSGHPVRPPPPPP